MLSRRYNTFFKVNYNSHRTDYYNQGFPDLVPCKCCFTCVLCTIYLIWLYLSCTSSSYIGKASLFLFYFFHGVFFHIPLKKPYIPTYFKSKQETFPSFVPYSAGTGELQYGIFTFWFSCKEMNYFLVGGIYCILPHMHTQSPLGIKSVAFFSLSQSTQCQ